VAAALATVAPLVKTELPYGTWPSPVTAEMLTTGAVGLIDVWVDGDRTVWLESRPAEGGRVQVVVLDGTTPRALLPEGCSARSAVHEYGGGAAWVERQTVWFVNWSDQRIYRMPLDGSAPPRALTPEPEVARSVRYADLRLSPDGNRLVCVRERHLLDAVHNEVVLVDAHRPGPPTPVYGASDFSMSPRFAAPDRLRFVAWNHPHMPWNSTSLFEAMYDSSGTTGEPHPIATGASFMQPDGDIVISDRSGWWNLWAIASNGAESPIHPIDAEIGGPAWVFGDRDYTVLDDGRIVYSIGPDLYVDGRRHHTSPGTAGFSQFAAAGSTVTAIARYVDRHPSIVRFDAGDPTSIEVVATPAATELDRDDISIAREIDFATTSGRAYAWFYPPTSSRYAGPEGDKPPLVTMIHGGPTSRAEPVFSIARQFWTSRGFAVVDVNHRGSTGYGTEFRNLLDRSWGVVDVEDCFAAAEWLAEQGLVDRSKMVIRGGSAGGFTVLSCLAFGDVFAAGASLYGVADLTLLASDTHKFEARYLDRLVGPWPRARELYEQRSPIHHLDAFTTPLIVFQGLDDMVVPPGQSGAIVEALAARGVEHEYHSYAGEGHGFRKADTIVDQLTKELAFYRRVLRL
jgi:dipeptidyl aminopeptidase/acylaminoacyl peptidase